MPLYDMKCKCGKIEERLIPVGTTVPCPECGEQMERQYTTDFMVKMKGEGGYPSRRKQVFNTTSRTHPPLEHPKQTQYFY